MDNSAARNKWMDRKALENYRHAMAYMLYECCMSVQDEALSELCYDLVSAEMGMREPMSIFWVANAW